MASDVFRKLFGAFFQIICCNARADFPHSSTNKAFIASIPAGSYEVVHPFQIRDRNERIGIDTRDYILKAIEHYQHITIVIRSNAAGRIKLVLERNDLIFFNQTRFQKLDSNGESGFPQRIENCYYQGTVAGDPYSFVSLSSCNGLRHPFSTWLATVRTVGSHVVNGFRLGVCNRMINYQTMYTTGPCYGKQRGVIAFSNGSAYGVWPLDVGDRGRRHPHVLYKTHWVQDVKCGASMAPIEHAVRRKKSQEKQRNGRDLSKQTKYVELAIIGDNEYVRQHGYSETSSLMYMLETVNVADLMYSRDLNVRLSVVYAEIWSDNQRVDLFEDLERTMGGVVDYSTGHMHNIEKDATILFTGGSFANSEAINSVFQSICTARSSVILKSVDAFAAHFSGQLLAQSIGHLFGLEHDTKSCLCEVGSSNHQCIMNPMPGAPGAPFTWQFSKCSIARIHGIWRSDLAHCLLNRPFRPRQLQECGNGVVDESEECDCGNSETCVDPCCDPLTCTLRAHAQCAAHHKCCHRCELRKTGEMCRAARTSCDIAEMCDGKSGDCPPDGHLVDGTACGIDGLCWRGNCSDPNQHCKTIWGEDARVGEQECFKQNVRGHEYANCGSSEGTSAFRPCQGEHVRCGTLHCQGGSAAPLHAALRSFTFQFQQEEKQVQCKSVAIEDSGMVRDGTSCGTGRVCVAGTCVEISLVSNAAICPSNNHALQCSGHGDCTTTASCICHTGWAGSACDTRTNNSLSKTTDLSRSLVVIPSIAGGRTLDTATLLGILLLVGAVLLFLLVCLLFCYRRRTVLEVPTPLDEKLGDSPLARAERSIKFGNLPSWREEKRKRKSNKHVYGALNRITEADERDSTSLKSRESNQNASNQILFDPRHVTSYNRITENNSDNGCDHMYADSTLVVSDDRASQSDYQMRSLKRWSRSSSASNEQLTPAPLRLNNIKQLLRNLKSDDEVEQEYHGDSIELLSGPYPSETHGIVFKSRLMDDYGEEELSGIEADHDQGSNTESSRGYDLQQSGGADVMMGIADGSVSSFGRNSCDYRQSPSLFNDSFRLEMSSSIHT